MPSPIAGETSVDEREPASLIGASRKKRKRKRLDSDHHQHHHHHLQPHHHDRTTSSSAGGASGRSGGGGKANNINNNNDDDDGASYSSGGEMSPEEDSTASPPAGLIAGRDDGAQQRLTSPPSGSKFVHEMSSTTTSGRQQQQEDEFGDTCMEESTIIKNRSEDDDDDDEDGSSGSSDNEDDRGPINAAAVGVGNKEKPMQVDESSTSDVENFDGKIVYNPDGSAYIIEDSELSDEDANELPQLMGNGCIVDGRGVNVSRSEGFPQIANAIYVSSRTTNHHALYGGNLANCVKPDKSIVPEVPVMHSYRVYSVRDNKYSERNSAGGAAKNCSQDSGNSGGAGENPSSVPVKPILMCFICKLSFGYAKSFVAHAMSDHNVLLQEDEKDILSHKNTSAIIQCVGKEKEPLVSFLEPLSPPTLVTAAASSVASTTTSSVGGSMSMTGSSAKFDGMGKYHRPTSSSSSSSAATSTTTTSSAHHQHLAGSPYSSFGGNSGNIAVGNTGVPNSNANAASSGNALSCVMDLTRKSPISSGASAAVVTTTTNSGSGGSNNGAITSPGASPSPGSTVSPLLSASSMSFAQHPPNFLTGTTIGVCPDHMGGRPSGVDCAKCELILSSSRLGGVGGGPLVGMHSRNSCKTLKCPKCNWHYKYQETLEIHMKEKHPETETSCIYCIAGQPHPRLARGETYTCGYKPYRCEVCNYSTTTKGNLSIHMQSDKHLNNMQELQNGTVSNSELGGGSVGSGGHQPSPAGSSAGGPGSGVGGQPKPTGMTSPSTPGGPAGLPYHSQMGGGSPAVAQQQKPKPTFRCDVCNYETNVARNLRIHMTSEKHTHNMMVLQQNMKQMQALSAIQPASQHQQQLNFEQLLHFHPGLTLPGEKPPPHSEAALADMAYNQALLIQLMTGGQLPPHMSPEMAPNLDMGLNPETMEPPPEPADLNPDNLFQCCVCNVFTSDSLEALSHHLAADRTKIREQEILAIVAGHYVCKLCTYKTTLKANFQLHCKTDKHLQRLQHVNHVKEGGPRNEWKLKYVSSPGGVQVRCNACDYYTNSTHKLQLHAAAQRHEFSASLFRHLRDNYDDSAKIYQCLLCEFSCADKLPLFQHIRSMQHLKIEQIHQLHRRSAGKDAQIDLTDMFKVIAQPSDSISEQGLDYCNQSQCSASSTTTPNKPSHPNTSSGGNNNVQQTPPSHRFSPSSSTASSSGSKDMETKCTQSDSSEEADDGEEGAVGGGPGSDIGGFDEGVGIRCSTCQKMFRNSEELCLHQNENGHFDIKQIEGSVFLCPKKECSAYFTTVLNVQRHYLDVHIQQNRMDTVAVSEKHVYKYRCSQCSLAFKTMEKLQIHSQYHFIRDATKCVLCGRSFRSIISLQKHVETAHADLTEEEMLVFKQSLLSNPLLLAGLSGQALDPSIAELLKKESLRMDTDESMDEDGPMVHTKKTSSHHDDTSPTTLHNKKVPHRKGEKVVYPMEKYLDPNRPYKCEVCKESFTQKNILLVHYNSVSHLHKLKRASQDLQSSSAANCGNTAQNLLVSPTSHYNSISQQLQQQHKKTTISGSMISPTSAQMLTPKSNSSSEDDDRKSFKENVGANASTSPVSSMGGAGHHGMFSCQRCNSIFISQDQLHAHQQLCWMTMFPTLTAAGTPTTTAMQFSPQVSAADLKTPPPSMMAAAAAVAGDEAAFMKLPQQAKKSSQMYKHLLESFGFDLVMQFNENHQRRQRKEREENERLLAELQSAQLLNEESHVMEARKDSSGGISDNVKEEKDDVAGGGAASADELPEVSKSTCAHCNKEFSSVWVLKAHCEEVHKDLVPLDFLEKYAQQIKSEIEKKGIPAAMSASLTNSMAAALVSAAAADADMANSSATTTTDMDTTTSSKASGTCGEIDSTMTTNVPTTTTADVGTDTYRESDDTLKDHNQSANDTLDSYRDSDERDQSSIMKDTHHNEPSRTPNPPTACSTPASSTDSISPSGGAGGNQSGNPSPNISMSLAQQMNEMQAALNAMAASQLQQQLQQFNPMMMGMASLGMGLPLGLNMPALAAMNLQPPLVPMMMPPPPSFDSIVGLGQGQNPLFTQQAAANLETSSILAKQQQHLMQQQQVANASQQKRARTRITDDQLKILRAHFDINNSPSEEQINKMAAESGLPPKVIKHWFRNTLFKERQRNKDSPYNFNNPPSTTLNLEEYEKTGEAKVIPLNCSNSGDESGVTGTGGSLGSMTTSNEQNNNIDSSALKMNLANVTNTTRKTSTPNTGNGGSKCDQMSPFGQSNHGLQQPPFSAPRSVASSPVLIKTEPKDGSECGVDLHNKLNVLPDNDASNRVKKEEYDDIKPNLAYMHDQVPHSPPSPNISERLSSVPTPCSSPENLTVSSVFNSQHLSAELTATSSSMLNAAMHQSSNMLPPKLNQNFSTSTPSLTNANYGPTSAMPNRSVSPGRSNSVDCFSHGVLSSGNSNGSNSSGGSSGKRANRTRFTDYQIKVLQEFFENNAYPKDDDLEYLSKLLSLSPRVIVVWFQNARQKARKVYENQPPVEPVAGIDENTGRFQRTPGLNYQCKKCLLVFQRYYELIRHQKTHCFKEEDAKRSAQAQAAAAQMAAVLSSEDSNSSTIIEQNQQCSVTNSNPSTPAAPVTPTPSSAAYPPSPVSHNPPTPESKETTLQCENCNLVFPRFELWREHQLIHIMNPNLFPNYPPESPFGILQQQAQQQQQQSQQQQQTQQQQQSQQSNQQHDPFSASAAAAATNANSQLQAQAAVAAAAAAAAAGSDMNANSNPPSPHPLLAMFNSNKRKYEEYIYLSDKDSDQPKDKRLRTTILPEQLDYLYQKYQIESNPSRKMLENIANEVGLKKRVVQVWFQNTRARERKGQFRAHSQVINKRCPFCPALFKVKTALESHLTSKHADHCSRGEINIDALPDEDVSLDSTSFLSQQSVASSDQQSTAAAAKFANFNAAANSMLHPLFAASMHGANENDAQIKKYYEDALRRYLTEIQSQQQHNLPNGSLDKENFPADFSAAAAAAAAAGKIMKTDANDNPTEATGESPLDLSKPVDLSNPIKFTNARPDDRSIISNGPLTDMNDRSMCDDEYSDSECSENMEDESPPASPASSRRIWSADAKSGRQQAEEEWSSDDERAMKEKILKAQQSTLQSIMEAIGDGSGMSSSVDSTIVVNKGELNGQQIPLACAHKEVDIGYICKRCKLVFPNEPALRSHQSKTSCCGMLRIKQYVYGCKMCNDDYQFNSIQDMQRHFEHKHPRCTSPLADEMENVVNQITALAAAKAAAGNNEDSNGNLFCQPGDVAKKSKLFAAVAQNTNDGQDSNGNLFCQPADVAKKSKLFAVPNNIAAPTGGH